MSEITWFLIGGTAGTANALVVWYTVAYLTAKVQEELERKERYK